MRLNFYAIHKLSDGDGWSFENGIIFVYGKPSAGKIVYSLRKEGFLPKDVEVYVNEGFTSDRLWEVRTIQDNITVYYILEPL